MAKKKSKKTKNNGCVKSVPPKVNPDNDISAIHAAIDPYLKMSSYQRSHQKKYNMQSFNELFGRYLGEVNSKDNDGKSVLYKLLETFLEWFEQLTPENLSEQRFISLKGLSEKIEFLTSLNIDIDTMDKCHGETPCELLLKAGDVLRRFQYELVENPVKLSMMAPSLLSDWNKFFKAHHQWSIRVQSSLVALSLKYSPVEDNHPPGTVIRVLPNGEHEYRTPGAVSDGISIGKFTPKGGEVSELDCFSSGEQFCDLITSVELSGGGIRSIENNGVTEYQQFDAKLEVEVERFDLPWRDIESLARCSFSVTVKNGCHDRLMITEMIPYPYSADYLPECLNFLELYTLLVREDQQLDAEFSALNFEEACLTSVSEYDAAPGEMMEAISQQPPKRIASSKEPMTCEPVLLSKNSQTLWPPATFREGQAQLRVHDKSIIQSG